MIFVDLCERVKRRDCLIFKHLHLKVLYEESEYNLEILQITYV